MLLYHLLEVIVAHDVRVQHEEHLMLVIAQKMRSGETDWAGSPHRLALD